MAAHAQGLRLHYSTIRPAEAVDEGPAYAGGLTVHDPGTALENARVSIAGRLIDHDVRDKAAAKGVRLETIVEKAHDDDLAFARGCLEAADGDKARAAVLAESVEDEAAEILDDREDLLGDLAAALFERGRLEEPEILAILGPYPEVSPETLGEREATRAKHTAK